MKTETVRSRGVVSVQADANPNAVLAQLTKGFEDFKNKHAEEQTAINASIDEINAAVAASKIGGGVADNERVSAGVRQGQANLGEFARHGARASMESGSDPKGGFLVQPELEKRITRYQRDLSPMRRLARVVATGSDTYQIPMAASGVESGWVSEKQERPNTETPDLVMASYPVHEVYANPAVTQTLLDDSVENIGAFLSDEIALAFDDKEGSAFVNGDGVGKPRGFLTYPLTNEPDAVRAHGKLQFVETESTTIAPDDLINLLFALRAGYRAGSSWLMSSATAAVVRKLKDADGNHIWSVSSEPGVLPSLLGYPVEFDEGMPPVAAGSTPIAFGNFQRGYLIVDRKGVRLLRDDLTNKPFVQFYTTKRVGGGIYESNAIKVLKLKV